MMLRLGRPKGITFSGPLSYSQTLKDHTAWYKQMWIIVDIAKDLDFIIKTKTIQKIIQSRKDKYCMILLLWGISNSQSYRKHRVTVTKNGGKRNGDLLFNVYNVSITQDEYIL